MIVPCLPPRGGKIYQVLREPTLSLHPNSLLTQLAEDQKDDKPIFVEGVDWIFTKLPDPESLIGQKDAKSVSYLTH